MLGLFQFHWTKMLFQTQTNFLRHGLLLLSLWMSASAFWLPYFSSSLECEGPGVRQVSSVPEFSPLLLFGFLLCRETLWQIPFSFFWFSSFFPWFSYGGVLLFAILDWEMLGGSLFVVCFWKIYIMRQSEIWSDSFFLTLAFYILEPAIVSILGKSAHVFKFLK